MMKRNLSCEENLLGQFSQVYSNDWEVMKLAWFYLIMAGLSEIVWAFGLKESHGFTMLGGAFDDSIFDS